MVERTFSKTLLQPFCPQCTNVLTYLPETPFSLTGVLWSNGDSWKEMRRFALTNLRDFGMGKKASEDKIIDECEQLIEVFKKYKGEGLIATNSMTRDKVSILVMLISPPPVSFVAGEAFDLTKPMNCAVSNIICSIIYGSRFEYNDPEFTSLVDRTNKNIQLVGSPSIQVLNLYNYYS